jgi:hypothetical protein
VRDDAATCPFCGSAFIAGRPVRYPPSVRVTAVAAVSAAVALGGCSASATASYGFPSPEDCCTTASDATDDLADVTPANVTVAESGPGSDAGAQEGEGSADAAPMPEGDAPADAGADGATD